ncbi:hypothetical protein GPAL_3012 [Glaciecola pallidula DSM 14239 = ACAM 615]|uniref:Uncharacterized protein n=2 Tax=Brumicola TaxID=3160924 RepID=K6ZLW4_9ALTE|nr:hypothetical protein GPAL_3012 [Glaciecola pallidula DSM 14239 = ACAM 615]
MHLVGIYTRNQVILDEQTKLYGCKTFLSFESLLQQSDIDIVYLSSPTGLHEEQIRLCIEYGKSVLVEKTALPSFPIAAELVKLALEKQLFVMEAFMYRFHKQYAALKNLIDSNKYGQPLRIECEFGFPHLPQNDIRYKKSLCGGATFDAGAYTISAARNLLGADASFQWSILKKDKQFEVDIGGMAILSNAKTEAVCSWHFGGSYINKISIWCEEAHIICDRAFSKAPEFESQILVENNGQVIETILVGKANHFVNMFSFIASRYFHGSLNSESNELVLQSAMLESVLRNGAEK